MARIAESTGLRINCHEVYVRPAKFDPERRETSRLSNSRWTRVMRGGPIVPEGCGSAVDSWAWQSEQVRPSETPEGSKCGANRHKSTDMLREPALRRIIASLPSPSRRGRSCL